MDNNYLSGTDPYEDKNEYLSLIEEAKKEIETNLYYTPKEEDLVYGLRFQLLDDFSQGNGSSKWNDLTYGHNNTHQLGGITSIYPIEKDRIRVKYLDVQDLKELGFESSVDNDIYKLKSHYKDEENKPIYLHVQLKKSDNKDVITDIYYEYLFGGRLQQDRLFCGVTNSYIDLKRILKATTNFIK